MVALIAEKLPLHAQLMVVVPLVELDGMLVTQILEPLHKVILEQVINQALMDVLVTLVMVTQEVLVVEGEGLPTGDHRPPAVGGRCGRFSFPNVHLGEGDIQLGLGRITSSHGRGETSTHVARSPGGAVGAHELTRGEGESRLGFLFRDGDLRHMLRKNSKARESQ